MMVNILTGRVLCEPCFCRLYPAMHAALFVRAVYRAYRPGDGVTRTCDSCGEERQVDHRVERPEATITRLAIPEREPFTLEDAWRLPE